MTSGWWQRASDWLKSHWNIIRRILTLLFVGVIVTLLILAATRVQWAEVLKAVRAVPVSALWVAAAITLASFVVYSTYDLLGKRYTGHPLAWWRSMMVCFISYAFNLNMGAPVGSVGMRMRLYAKQGLAPGVIMRILALSFTTNWIGYMVLSGIIFALGGVQLPPEWNLGNGAFRLIGAAMCLGGIAYLLLCAFSSTRSWNIRGHEIELPTLGMALVQVGIGMLNWALIGAVIYVLMQQKVDYLLVLGAFLVSAIVGALTHIPGGLGVIESVFIALLASEALPRSQVLGAILVFRAIYYLAPLFIAGLWYLGAEAKIQAPDDVDEKGATVKPGSR